MSEYKTLANPFQFSSLDVRTAVDEHGDVLFCAKDVCDVLEITWAGRGNTLRSIPETWIGVSYHETPGGMQEMIFLKEPAVYKLVFRSNKPKAEEFANWVCEEVLPQIRKHGFFGTVEGKDRLAYSKQIIDISTRLAETKDAMLFKLLATELRDLCNLIGRKMPELHLLGKDYKQLELIDKDGKLAIDAGTCPLPGTGGVQ